MRDAKLIEKNGEWILSMPNGTPKDCMWHRFYPNGNAVICSNRCAAFEMESEIPVRYERDQVTLHCMNDGNGNPYLIDGIILSREDLKKRQAHQGGTQTSL